MLPPNPCHGHTRVGTPTVFCVLLLTEARKMNKSFPTFSYDLPFDFLSYKPHKAACGLGFSSFFLDARIIAYFSDQVNGISQVVSTLYPAKNKKPYPDWFYRHSAGAQVLNSELRYVAEKRRKHRSRRASQRKQPKGKKKNKQKTKKGR